MDTINIEQKGTKVEEPAPAAVEVSIESPIHKSLEYQALVDRIEDLKEGIAKTESIQVQIKYGAQLTKALADLQQFKTAVEQLTIAFNRVTSNTQRVGMAKILFGEGAFKKSRAILELGKMPYEAEVSIIKDEIEDEDAEANQWTLKKKGVEFCLLAHLMAVDFNHPNYIQRAKEYFALSYSASPSEVNTFTYAHFLKNHSFYEEAIPLFQSLLAKWNNKLASAPEANLPDIARGMNSMGEIYAALNNYEKARRHFHEAFSIQRNLMVLNQEAHLKQLALIHHNMGDLFKTKNHYNLTDDHYNEALKIQRKLAQIDPEAHLPKLADALDKLGKLHRERLRHDLAVTFYQQSMEIRRDFVNDDPDRYLPGLAETLNKLGNLQRDRNSYDIAEMFYEEALEIKRELVDRNPYQYLPGLGTLLNNLGILYRDDKKPAIAKVYFDEAMEYYRLLVKHDAQTHLPDAGMTLNNMGILYRDKKNYDFAAQHFIEALHIYEKLSEEDPEQHLAFLATVHNNYGSLFMDQGRYERAEKHYKKAFLIRKELSVLRPDYYSPELGMIFLNLSTFYQICKPNQNLSLLFVDAAITSLLPFNTIPYIQSYYTYAAKVLRTWGLDVGKYVKDRGFSEAAVVKKSLKMKFLRDKTKAAIQEEE